jgi:hypothetical protein
VTAGPQRQAAEQDRDFHQRDPACQHVLDAGDPVVVVDVAAARARLRAFWVYGAQHLGRVGERPGPEDAPDYRAQFGQVGDPVEGGAEHRGAERGIGQRVHGVDRARLDGRYAPVVHPAAGAQPLEDYLPGRPDLVLRQQAAEEQVPVGGQPAPQSIWIGDQMG